MADPDGPRRATVHSNRRLPLLYEFAFKPGRITLARLSQSKNQLRLVIGGGEVLKRPLSFSGTSGVVRFDRPAGEVLDAVIGEGLEHHMSLAYGDHRPALRRLARMLDIPALELT
jgi:L-fucose isomerase-like protein